MGEVTRSVFLGAFGKREKEIHSSSEKGRKSLLPVESHSRRGPSAGKKGKETWFTQERKGSTSLEYSSFHFPEGEKGLREGNKRGTLYPQFTGDGPVLYTFHVTGGKEVKEKKLLRYRRKKEKTSSFTSWVYPC